MEFNAKKEYQKRILITKIFGIAPLVIADLIIISGFLKTPYREVWISVLIFLLVINGLVFAVYKYRTSREPRLFIEEETLEYYIGDKCSLVINRIGTVFVEETKKRIIAKPTHGEDSILNLQFLDQSDFDYIVEMLVEEENRIQASK